MEKIVPLYYFALDDDLSSSGASEELPDDQVACDVAILIAGELSRNRFGREQTAVSVFDERGRVVRKVWTRTHYNIEEIGAPNAPWQLNEDAPTT